jgi:acyl transferase domain-containing protein
MVPNGLAQQSLLREALARSGIKPADVDYVDAHGTGTALGDPVELEALAAVMGEGRPADRPLAVGSVKTNIGHLRIPIGLPSGTYTIQITAEDFAHNSSAVELIVEVIGG